MVSGSDTHQAVQYGCVTTVFERDVDTVPALYGEMTAGRYAIDLSDTAAFQVRTACLLKRSLKEIHALGGDYVAISDPGSHRMTALTDPLAEGPSRRYWRREGC